MKKTVICSLTLASVSDVTIYHSADVSIPVSDRPVRYSINAMLEATCTPEDEIKVILLAKRNAFYKKNLAEYMNEIDWLRREANLNIKVVEIRTDFSETVLAHDDLMGRIVEEIETGSTIIADITYGTKAQPIIIFAALSFAEKHLACEIENIIYSLVKFNEEGNVVAAEVYGMTSLFYLSSVANEIKCNGSEQSRAALKTLLSR